MKSKYIYCAFLLCSVFVTTFQERLVDNCGVKLEDVTQTVSQGDSASNYAPWVVSIGSGKGIEEEYLPLCTGTIITESVTLTAAHCISDRRYIRIVVYQCKLNI